MTFAEPFNKISDSEAFTITVHVIANTLLLVFRVSEQLLYILRILPSNNL